MSKDAEIHFRVTPQEKTLYSKIAKRTGRTLSNYARQCIENSKDIELTDEEKQQIQNLSKIRNIRQIAQEWKSDNRDLYLVPNTIKRIMDLVSKGYFLTGTINMGIVKAQIKYAQRVYHNQPPWIKEATKEEMIKLIELQQEKILQPKMEGFFKLSRVQIQ